MLLSSYFLAKQSRRGNLRIQKTLAKTYQQCSLPYTLFISQNIINLSQLYKWVISNRMMTSPTSPISILTLIARPCRILAPTMQRQTCQCPSTMAPISMKVERSCSIYKPSFNINVQNGSLLLQFQYDSTNSTNLQVYIGVIDVSQDINSQVTIKIDSKIQYIEPLAVGKKLKFTKLFALNGFSSVESSNIIIRVVSQVLNEATEYSLRKVRQHWNVLLQKFELNNIVTQLSNIYKGDQTNECIICMSETSNTLIEPCNHLCLCQDCLSSVKKSTNKCPICRTSISHFKVIAGKS